MEDAILAGPRSGGRWWMERGTMDWSWIGRLWRMDARRGAAGREAKSDQPEPEPQRLRDWEARLVEAGVTRETAVQIAIQLAPAHERLGRGTASALVQGASLAFAVQAGERASVERSLRDVREVERLLGAFSGELEKLDEVLEVLSAYAQRMRSKPLKTPDRTLH